MIEADRARRSLELRYIQLYFWIYCLMCLNGTYLNLFLKRESGLTGTQIGFLSGSLSAAGVILTPLIGLRFDASRRRPAFLSNLALLAGLAFCLYMLPVPWYALIPVAVLFACGWLPIVPLNDSIANTEQVTGASRHGYGGYRRWGTVGFALAGGLSGQLTGAFGLRAAFVAYALCALMVAWLMRGIPRRVAEHVPAAGRPGGEIAPRVPRFADVVELARLPGLRRFLMVTLLSSVGASSCYAFRSIYLSSIGMSDRAIGMLWLLIIPGEVVCFTLAARWQKRWGTGPLVMTGLVLAGTRWILLGYAQLPALYLVELLHGVGFAVYWPSAVKFVQDSAPHRLRGTAQILFFSTAAGIGNAIGPAIAGRVYDLFGMRPVLWFGGSLLILSGVLQVAFVRHPAPARA